MDPTEEYVEDIEHFRQEILDCNDEDRFAGCGCLETASSALEWIDCNRMMCNADACPDGRVPSNVYIAVRESDNRIVGVIDLRHHINTPVLSTWGGHTGYTVRPSERKKGYATRMLKLLLEKAKGRGIEKILVVCNTDNTGSEKTIFANGGIFEREIVIDGCAMRRYWITV